MSSNQASYRAEANAAVRDLLQMSEVDFDSGTKLQQALIGTFVFGMVYAHGRVLGLSPPQIHALASAVYQDVLHYTAEAAAEGVQDCIDATAPGNHDSMNAIMHRGIDGHRQHIAGDFDGLRQNIRSVLEQFNAA